VERPWARRQAERHHEGAHHGVGDAAHWIKHALLRDLHGVIHDLEKNFVFALEVVVKAASQIGERCHIVSSTVEMAEIGNDVSVGPYAHLRPGAHVGSGAEIGNYAEIKKSTLGSGTKMHHFSYVGDAQVGANVNIGAGSITCNFDGVAKHQTVIEDEAFIGSDTLLRAPVRVGKGAFTGAGSVVTRDVPSGATAVGMPARVIRMAPKRESSATEQEGNSGSQTRREC